VVHEESKIVSLRGGNSTEKGRGRRSVRVGRFVGKDVVDSGGGKKGGGYFQGETVRLVVREAALGCEGRERGPGHSRAPGPKRIRVRGEKQDGTAARQSLHQREGGLAEAGGTASGGGAERGKGITAF